MSYNSDDFLTPTTEDMDILQKRYGEMNPKGIAWFREHFDTYKSRQAVVFLKESLRELNPIVHEVEQLHDAARDIVDNDTFCQNKYDIEEFGDISLQADHLRMCLSELEDKLEAARLLLAPFERLTVIEGDADDMDLEDGMIVAVDEHFTPRLFEEHSFFDED